MEGQKWKCIYYKRTVDKQHILGPFHHVLQIVLHPLVFDIFLPALGTIVRWKLFQLAYLSFLLELPSLFQATIATDLIYIRTGGSISELSPRVLETSASFSRWCSRGYPIGHFLWVLDVYLMVRVIRGVHPVPAVPTWWLIVSEYLASHSVVLKSLWHAFLSN